MYKTNIYSFDFIMICTITLYCFAERKYVTARTLFSKSEYNYKQYSDEFRHLAIEHKNRYI